MRRHRVLAKGDFEIVAPIVSLHCDWADSFQPAVATAADLPASEARLRVS